MSEVLWVALRNTPGFAEIVTEPMSKADARTQSVAWSLEGHWAEIRPADDPQEAHSGEQVVRIEHLPGPFWICTCQAVNSRLRSVCRVCGASRADVE